MIIVKPQKEKNDCSYNILFPEANSISFFDCYDDLINSLFYDSDKDIIDINLPVKDINYVSLFIYLFFLLRL